MAAAATKCYKKLLCAQIEMQQHRGELLGQLSVQHAKGNSADPNIALANVLADQEATVKNLKSIEYPCNKTKIYDVSKNPPILRNPLDIQVIDTTLQHDFLLWLEGFPVSKPSKANQNNKVRCTGACAQLCKRKDICCDRCMQCNDCNKCLPAVQQCSTFKLKLTLEKDKLLRNLVSHLTLKTLENFLNGTEKFPDFLHVNNWQDLSQEFVNTMTCISDYMVDVNNFNNPNVKLLQQHEKTRKLNKLQAILDEDMKTKCDLKTKRDLDLLKNLKQIIKEQHQKQIDEHKKQIDELENVVADLKNTIIKNHREVAAQLGNIEDEVVETNRKLDIFQDGQTNTHLKLDDLKRMMERMMESSKTSSDDQATKEKSKKRQKKNDETWTFEELSDLLYNEATLDQFNEIIKYTPSLTKLRDDNNNTLLHKAVLFGATECVEVLIETRCLVKEKNFDGQMAIHYAAWNNHTQMMKILLSRYPYMVNVTNNKNYNWTPLHGAAFNNHREAVEFLLSEPSVDVNVRDDDGQTPYEWTRDEQIKKMIRSHRNYSPPSTTDA